MRVFFFFQAEDGIRDYKVTGVQTCALPIFEGVSGRERPLYVLPNGGGLGYGLFILDDASRDYLLGHIEEIPDALTRGSAWEIGRASCRERVSRPGGGVSIT